MESNTDTDDDILERLSLTLQQRAELEERTRKQDDSDWHDAPNNWFKVWTNTSTEKKTVALLQFCIYPKTMVFLPKPIEWGKKMETKGRQACVKHMQMHGHPGLQMTRSRLVVQPVKG